MQVLSIDAKEDTPMVMLDSENQVFEIIGKSLPEDVLEFYQPVFDWLEEYVKAPNDSTVFKMKIEYFNSASHKVINDILEILAEIKTAGNSIKIHWHYLEDDEDMLEAGQDFADLTGLDFEYVSYN